MDLLDYVLCFITRIDIAMWTTHLLSYIIVPDPLCGFAVDISAICIVPAHPRSCFIFQDARVDELNLNICVSRENRNRIEIAHTRPFRLAHFLSLFRSVFQQGRDDLSSSSKHFSTKVASSVGL